MKTNLDPLNEEMNQYELYECFKNSVPWRASFAAPLNSKAYKLYDITPYPYWTGSAYYPGRVMRRIYVCKVDMYRHA